MVWYQLPARLHYYYFFFRADGGESNVIYQNDLNINRKILNLRLLYIMFSCDMEKLPFAWRLVTTAAAYTLQITHTQFYVYFNFDSYFHCACIHIPSGCVCAFLFSIFFCAHKVAIWRWPTKTNKFLFPMKYEYLYSPLTK